MTGIPVLMYHALEDEAHPARVQEPGAQLYTVTTRSFRDQMRHLGEMGYRSLLLEEIPESARFEKAVVLTFDDGHRSNITLALPILQELGFRAEFFVTTGWVGRPDNMTEEDIVHLAKAGMGVGSHGVSHAFFDELSASEAEKELTASSEFLSRLTDRPVRWFSAPGGRLRPGLEMLAAQAGYRGICTSAPGLLRPSQPLTRVPRWPVRGSTSLGAFSRIVRQPPVARVLAAARYTTLAGLKRCVGNDTYVRLHGWLAKVGNPQAEPRR